MPAVTVKDITILPRVVVDPNSRARRVKSITTAPQGHEGEGFPVRRAFAGVDLADLDPFIHLDQMGEVEYAPGEPKGTPWHPHRGFETVTYIIDGIFDHYDNHGGGGTISNGDTQWMTAGAGILHIETPPEHLVVSGGLFHGFQLWVNLPAAKKWSPPAYQDLRASDVALLSSSDGGVLLRVIAADLNQESRAPTMDVLILGGLPIREPVAWMGPFVMNTKTEVLKAFEDFQKGVLGVVPPNWSKAERPVQRDGIGYKLSGDLKGVHGTPEDLQEL